MHTMSGGLKCPSLKIAIGPQPSVNVHLFILNLYTVGAAKLEFFFKYVTGVVPCRYITSTGCI